MDISGPTEDAVSVALQAVVLRWRQVLAIACGSALFVVIALSLRAPQWEARTSFMPSGGDPTRAGLGGLAAQFGIGAAVAGSVGAMPPKYYADLATSPAVILSLFREPDGARVLDSLLGLTDVEPTTIDDYRVKAVKSRLRADVSRETGVVSLRMRLSDRQSALRFVGQVVEEVNLRNRLLRAERARQELQFLQERLDSVGSELNAAEDRLSGFLQSNRGYSNDPVLSAGFRRLERDVQLKQAVAASVSQNLEQARVDANRTTPVLLVTEIAYSTIRPLPRRRVVIGGLTLVLAASVQVLLVVLTQMRNGAGSQITTRARMAE
jgi:hypothetical protein